MSVQRAEEKEKLEKESEKEKEKESEKEKEKEEGEKTDGGEATTGRKVVLIFQCSIDLLSTNTFSRPQLLTETFSANFFV